MPASAEEILAFLKEFKRIASEKGVYVVSREKNRDTGVQLGLTFKNMEEEILSLSVTNYCDGPKEDRDRGGMIWEFGGTIGEHDIYIKLKIAEIEVSKGNVKKIAKCISFHIAEYPVEMPYSEEKRGDES